MKTIITLEEDNLPHIRFDSDGVERSFHTTMDYLLSAIHNAFHDIEEQEVKPVDTITLVSPSIPTNTVKYGKTSSGMDFITILVPASQQDVKYHQTEFKQVGYPNLLFSFLIKGESIFRKSCYTFKGRFVREDTALYTFPYANVGGNGFMCFYPGNYKVADLVQLQTFPNLWFGAAMNDHLYNPKRTTLNCSLRELLQNFEGKPFDHDILTEEVMLFKDIQNSLIY